MTDEVCRVDEQQSNGADIAMNRDVHADLTSVIRQNINYSVLQVFPS